MVRGPPLITIFPLLRTMSLAGTAKGDLPERYHGPSILASARHHRRHHQTLIIGGKIQITRVLLLRGSRGRGGHPQATRILPRLMN